MKSTRQEIHDYIVNKLPRICKILTTEYGRSDEYWLMELIKSRVYENIINYKTHMWSESDLYVRECLVKEIKPSGRTGETWVFVQNTGKTSYKDRVLYIQSSIIVALTTECRMRTSEVAEMFEKSGLLSYIARNYELYHIESIFNALYDIQKYVKQFRFTFKVGKRDYAKMHIDIEDWI